MSEATRTFDHHSEGTPLPPSPRLTWDVNTYKAVHTNHSHCRSVLKSVLTRAIPVPRQVVSWERGGKRAN